MLTLSPCAPAVKPAAIVAPAGAIAGFERWARDRMSPLPVPAVALAALDALLDFGTARDIEPDDYRPEWRGDLHRPSTGDLWADRGFAIGSAGDLVDAADAFPDAAPGELLRHAFDYAEGHHLGFQQFARQAGFDAGLAGRPCERPVAIPGRFTPAFELGWSRGDAERAERERVDEAYYNALDWDREYEIEQREIERFNREVGGWDRAGNLALI